MSLTVPITNSQMQSGVAGFAPPPSSGYAQAASMQSSGPAFSATAGTESNYVAFGAAGWIIFAVTLIFLVHHWGFRFAHVPV